MSNMDWFSFVLFFMNLTWFIQVKGNNNNLVESWREVEEVKHDTQVRNNLGCHPIYFPEEISNGENNLPSYIWLKKCPDCDEYQGKYQCCFTTNNMVLRTREITVPIISKDNFILEGYNNIFIQDVESCTLRCMLGDKDCPSNTRLDEKICACRRIDNSGDARVNLF